MDSYHLLQDMEQNSREAFDRFYQLHLDFVFQIAFHIVGNKAEAEDVCHDVFLEVYQKPHQYNPNKGSVKAWLAIKTKSRSLDHLRKKKPVLVERLESFLTATDKDAEITVLQELEREVILTALDHIPEDQRKVIYGAYFEGKTQRELADKMGRPLGTIKSLVRYGLNNLRKQKTVLHWMNSGGGDN